MAIHSDQAAFEQKCRTEWDRDPKLRAEFGCDPKSSIQDEGFSDYLAYRKAEASGRVHTHKRGLHILNAKGEKHV